MISFVNKTWFYVLVYCSIINFVHYTLLSVLAADQACIEDFKRTAGSEPFNEKEIEYLCDEEARWKAPKALGLAGGAPEAIQAPSASQTDFINDVTGCATVDECLFKPGPQGVPPGGTPAPSAGGIAPGPPGAVQKYVIRKEYRTLTDEERDLFNNIVNTLKTSKIDGISKYDLLVYNHSKTAAPEAHWGCAFLPYHRQLLKSFEVMMRRENISAFIPYWDSSLDQKLPNPCDSVLWTPELLGESNGPVTSGPFNNWRATAVAEGTNSIYLSRNCGVLSKSAYKEEDFRYFDKITEFKKFCYCNDKRFESRHGLAHNLIGGHMSEIEHSPNDPVFFMHHAFVDSIWERWRQANQSRDQREQDYPRDSKEACGSVYMFDAPLEPFPNDMKIIDGLKNEYTDSFYKYDPRPIDPATGCNGKYLYFDKSSNLCMSKIKLGGNCTGYENTDICYKGNCISGVCKEGGCIGYGCECFE